MLTISLHQPWATLWVSGLKKVETRHWALAGEKGGDFHHLGYQLPIVLAVHAAKKWDRAMSLFCEANPFFRGALKELGLTNNMPPLGCIVGGVRVVECQLITESLRNLMAEQIEEFTFGCYDVGRFAWFTDQRVLLARPVVETGRQRFWQTFVPELEEWAKALPPRQLLKRRGSVGGENWDANREGT